MSRGYTPRGRGGFSPAGRGSKTTAPFYGLIEGGSGGFRGGRGGFGGGNFSSGPPDQVFGIFMEKLF